MRAKWENSMRKKKSQTQEEISHVNDLACIKCHMKFYTFGKDSTIQWKHMFSCCCYAFLNVFGNSTPSLRVAFFGEQTIHFIL